MNTNKSSAGYPGWRRERQAPGKYIQNNWELYLFLLPAVAVIILFYYVPIYGVQIAFRDFDAFAGISGSQWVGMKNFTRFFNSHYFMRLIGNTLSLSFYQLIASFIVPIVLALLMSQIEHGRIRKLIQNVVYVPYFISVVVLVGMLSALMSSSTGIVNLARVAIGKKAVDFMAQPEYFRHLYVWSGVWQQAGWGTVIYIAALTGVNPELHEAAKVDGCNKPQRIYHIDIPSIVPTMVMVLILSVGRVMSLGFEKVYLMQYTLNLSVSEVISTYVYKIGLQSTDFSMGTAIGLFNSVINLILLATVNQIARRMGETSLW